MGKSSSAWVHMVFLVHEQCRKYVDCHSLRVFGFLPALPQVQGAVLPFVRDTQQPRAQLQGAAAACHVSMEALLNIG